MPSWRQGVDNVFADLLLCRFDGRHEVLKLLLVDFFDDRWRVAFGRLRGSSRRIVVLIHVQRKKRRGKSQGKSQ